MDSGQHASSEVPVTAAHRFALRGLLAVVVIPAAWLYIGLVTSAWDAEEFSVVSKVFMFGIPLLPVLVGAARRSVLGLIGGLVGSLGTTLVVFVVAVLYSGNTSGGI